MPRLATPKGYYTATEVKRILNISDAMIRSYAQKGKIRYVQPPGRKHGFYLKEDVDNLSNELNAFLNIQNEHTISTFGQAKKEDLAEIEKIAMSLFAPNSDDSNTTNSNNWRDITFSKNQSSQHVLKDVNSNIVGYLSTIPFNANTNKIEKLLSVDLISEVNIEENDIETFDRGKHIILYIGAIGVDNDLDEAKRHHYGARLLTGFSSFIVSLGERGVIIEKMAALGATNAGRKILQSYGFHEIPPLAEGKRAFMLEIEKSGSPVILRYKQALKESGTPDPKAV